MVPVICFPEYTVVLWIADPSMSNSHNTQGGNNYVGYSKRSWASTWTSRCPSVRINPFLIDDLWTELKKLFLTFKSWFCSLKGHGYEAGFLGFLQKLVPPHRSLPFEVFWFWLQICGDIHNQKTTPRLGESATSNSASRQLPGSAFECIKVNSRSHRVANSPTQGVNNSPTRRVTDSLRWVSRGVALWIFKNLLSL